MVEEREERQTFEARVRDFVFCRERRFGDDETEKVRALFCTAAYRDICTTSRTTWCLWSPRPPEGHADDLERLVPNTERGAASRVGFPDIRRIHVRSLISFMSLCRFAKTQEPLSVGVAAMRHHAAQRARALAGSVLRARGVAAGLVRSPEARGSAFPRARRTDPASARARCAAW